jgi:hypothetical protein
MIYDRDYTKLTEKEIKEFEKAKIHSEMNVKNLLKIPTAIFHHTSLFPNNLLSLDELKINEKTTSILNNFEKLLDDKLTNERDILSYIQKNRAYFIIASVFTNYRFGHHEAFAFPEFELPPNYKTDFLLIGKSSYGYEFIFIELEKPYNDITTIDGNLGITFRKGLKQIENWESWLESNFSHLKLIFEKYQGKYEVLPNEMLTLDTTRLHYIVIAGRRIDFNETTYRIARKMKKNNNVMILHYDNLVDSTKNILRSGNYV